MKHSMGGDIQYNQEIVDPFKHIDWSKLSFPVTDVTLLHSFRDKVKNGVREFPVGYENKITPILESLGIFVSFEPIYTGVLDPSFTYFSGFTMEDLLGPPRAFELQIDEQNYLKLTNIHF